MSTVTCPDCGNVNPEGTERCLKCDYALRFDPDADVPLSLENLQKVYAAPQPATAPPAPAAPAAPANSNACLWLIALGCALPLMIGGITWLWDSITKQPEPPAVSDHVAIGETGVLNNSDDQVLVAADKPSFDLLVKYAGAHDTEGIANLANVGSVFYLPSGTSVRIIDAGFTGWAEIRILTGDHYRESAYTNDEWVHKP